VNVVSDDIPIPQIVQPTPDPREDIAWAASDGSVTLAANGVDPVDEPEPDVRLRWSSDVDGFLGTGHILPVHLKAGTCGFIFHIVTLSITNNAGKQATATIRIGAGRLC
jgi:hypothetical protein